MADNRYAAPAGIACAEGWTCERVTPPSRLFGANGLRTGADGRIYVAQVPGSAIHAIDPDNGTIEAISPIDGPITAPDDLAFDEVGNIFATEITLGRVSMLTPQGEFRVINGDMPVANPITFDRGRLIAGECRLGGRVMELDREGGAPRVILADVPMPNAFEIGPDGKLYMPIMGTNEIWRVDLAGGAPEVVAGDLGVPDSVKFDSQGRIVSTQVATGQVLRIDPQTGAREVLAQLEPGLDNCTFVGERLFVSSIPGSVTEILPGGETRPLVARGLQWPMGLAAGPDNSLFVADGGFTYLMDANGELSAIGMLFTPGFPGFTRGVAAAGPGEWLTTNSMGAVMRWWPGEGRSEPVASGYEVLYGVADDGAGGAIFADGAAGRVLHAKGGQVEELGAGLATPMGVALTDDGTVLAGESEGGRIVALSGGRVDAVLDGLDEPQGIAVADGVLYVADVGARELVSLDLGTGQRRTLASTLPLRSPPGVQAKRLGGVGDMSGPMVPFCGVTVAADGTIYLAGDAEGSVLALRAS